MDFKSSRKKQKSKGLLRSWQETTIQAKAGVAMNWTIDLKKIREGMAILPQPISPNVLPHWSGLMNSTGIVPERVSVWVPKNIYPDPDGDSGRSSEDSPDSDNDEIGPPSLTPPGMTVSLNAVRIGMKEVQGSLDGLVGRHWNLLKNSEGNLRTVVIWPQKPTNK